MNVPSANILGRCKTRRLDNGDAGDKNGGIYAGRDY